MLKSYYSQPMLGWFAGCVTATLIIFILGMANLAMVSGGDFSDVFAGLLVYGFLFSLGIIPLIFVLVCALSGIPAVIVICLSEMLRIRSILFFGGGGAVIGGLSQFLLSRAFVQFPSLSLLFLGAGFAAGSAYWFVAGKYAGTNCSLPSRTT
jgi:hypothetical protein